MSYKDMLGNSALAEVAGPLKDFWEKLGGHDGPKWLADFKQFLRKENPWGGFPTWKTIKLGTHETMDVLREDLIAGGCRVSDWANDLLKKISVCPIEADVELVIASVADLGYPNGATRKEIYERAVELGLKLCPPEVGPQLRLQYEDQPEGEWLLVAMEPITDSHGRPRVFNVDRGSVDRWLSAYYDGPGVFWGGFIRWVFLRRK